MLGWSWAQAGIYQWKGTTDGAWGNPANWASDAGLTIGPAPTSGNFFHRLNVLNTNLNSPNHGCTYDASMGTTVYGSNGVRGLVIANVAPGNFRITGGTFATTNSSGAGAEDVLGSGFAGTFTNDGGTFISRVLQLGLNNGSGSGTLTLNGGSTIVSNLLFNYQSSGGSATVHLNGGTLRVQRLGKTPTSISGNHIFNFNAGTLVAGASSGTFLTNTTLARANVRNGGAKIDTAGFDIIIDQPLLHSNIGGDADTDGGLTKLGNGTLTLNGTNSYTGPTVVSAGTLALGASGGLPASSSFDLAAGAGLNVLAVTNFSFRAPLTATGTSTDSAELIGSGLMNLHTNAVRLSFSPTEFGGDTNHPALWVSSGTLTLDGPVSITNNGAYPLGSGAYVLIEQTTGVLSGLPTLSGAVAGQGIQGGNTAYLQISGRKLELVVVGPVATTPTVTRHAGTLATTTYGDTLQFDVNVTPTPSGGTVELRDGGVGGTLIGTGTLVGGNCAITPADTALKVGNHINVVARFLGYAQYLAGTSAALSPAQSVTQKSLTISGAGAESKFYDTTTTAKLTNGTPVGVESGDTVTLSLSGNFANAGPGTNIPVTSTSTLGGAAATNYTLLQPPGLSANIIGANVWTGAAGDTLWNTAGNWLSNSIPNGSTAAASFAALNITADTTVNLNAARTVQNLIFGDTNTASAASWLLANNGNSANTLTLGGTSPGITVDPLGSGADATIAAGIAGSAGLTKAGAGKLVLTAANTYSGGTKVNGGVLEIDGDSSLGAVPGVATTGNVTLNGGELALSAAFTLSANRGIALGASGGRISFTRSAGTYDGIIAGTGGLVIDTSTNAGGWVFGGASTFSGGTTLLGQGTVFPKRSTVGAPGSLASGPFGTGPLVLGGAAMRPSTGSGGDVTLGNATTIVEDTGFPPVGGEYSLIFSGPVTLTNGTNVLTVDVGSISGNKAVVFKGTVSESGGVCGLIKAGNGRLIFAGTNTFTGATTVTDGTLLLNATNPIAGPIILDAGGSLSPDGAPSGVATATGPLTLNGTLLFTVNRTNSPTCYRLAVPGTLNYGGTLKVVNAGPGCQAGDTFTIFSASNYVGSFSNLLLPALAYGLAWNTSQLVVNGTISVQTTTHPASTITLNPATTYQQIYGIGGNFAQGDQELLETYNRYNEVFSETGLNLSFIRLSTSFEMTNSRFAGYDSANVAVTAGFRARQPDGKITLTAWSPPEVLKSTGSAYQGTLAKVGGQYVYPSYGNWWARTMQYYQSNSALPDYLSIQNEPDFTPSGTNWQYEAGSYLNSTETSTKAGYPEALAAVKSALQAVGLGSTRFIGPDTTAIGGGKIPNYLNNLPAGSLFGIAHHLYHDSPATTGTTALSTLDSQYSYATWPKFMTELNPYDTYEDFAANDPDWMQLAVTMHNVFVFERANTYLVWNIMFGTVGYWDGQPVGTQTYYPLGHFSKFVRPNAWRANVTSSDANVLASLYRQTNAPGIADKLVLVLINKSGSYSYPTIGTSNFWAADPLQRSWRAYQTGDDGSTSYRLALLENESGGGLVGNRNLVLPPYSLTTAIINTGIASNAPPQFTSIASNRTITAGQTFVITNTATDPNQPAQTIAFSLPIAPTNATLNASNGILNWRPLIAQAGSNYSFRVVVADNAVPSLSATQNFNVTVNTPLLPVLSSAMVSNNQFGISITGSLGPDYILQASTNLVAWTHLFSTNPPALPFSWTDAGATNFPARFYRVLLGP